MGAYANSDDAVRFLISANIIIELLNCLFIFYNLMNSRLNAKSRGIIPIICHFLRSQTPGAYLHHTSNILYKFGTNCLSISSGSRGRTY